MWPVPSRPTKMTCLEERGSRIEDRQKTRLPFPSSIVDLRSSVLLQSLICNPFRAREDGLRFRTWVVQFACLWYLFRGADADFVQVPQQIGRVLIDPVCPS